MLTIKAPIEITAHAGFMSDPEAFYRRITGNYQLMVTAVTPEDLLHVSATPPEIYVAESEGMTSILSRSERNETNIHKVEIINNVLNRILMSADVGLTYQDRVFITDALYKLGIRDDRRFMSEFYRLAQETRNTNELVNIYLSHTDHLRELIELAERTRTLRETRTEGVTGTEETNTFYNSIMNRLTTDSIYQTETRNTDELVNINLSHPEPQAEPTELTERIQRETRTEVVTETEGTNNFYNSIMNRQTTGSIYQTETRNTDELVNINLSYSEPQVELTEFTERTQRETRTERVTETEETNTLYNSIMNRLMTGAIYQIVSNFNRSNDDHRIDAREYTVAPQTYIAQQLLLGRLREMTGTGSPELIYRSENSYEDAFYEGDVDESHVEENLTSAVMMELLQNLYHAGYERFFTQNTAYYRLEDSFYRSATEVLNRIMDNRMSVAYTKEENIRRSEVTNRMARQEITLLNRIFENDFGDVYESLEQFVTRNELRENRYSQLRTEYYVQAQGHEESPAGSEPEPLSLEERRAETPEKERVPEPGSPEEAEAILRAVNELNVQNEMRRRQLEEIVERSERARVRQTPEEQIERTRADARLALHQPELLQERLKEHEEREIVREHELMREIQSILPPQGAQVYQILQQYEENPQLFQDNRTIRPAEISELMSDIQEVEREREFRETSREELILRESEKSAQEHTTEVYQDNRQFRETAKQTVNNLTVRQREAAQIIDRLREVVREQLSQDTDLGGRGGETVDLILAGERRTGTPRAVSLRQIPGTPEPVSTVHRRTQTLTGEELEETLQEMESRLTKKVRQEVREDVTETTRVSTSQTQVINEIKHQETQQISIDRMVDDGVRRRMNAISDQVYRKLERRLQSEKIRRGF